MPARHKAIVLDANILIRAVLGPWVRDLILANGDHVHFFLASVCVADTKRYLPVILASRRMDPILAMRLLDEILQHIEVL
jgi:hypothetical protein